MQVSSLKQKRPLEVGEIVSGFSWNKLKHALRNSEAVLVVVQCEVERRGGTLRENRLNFCKPRSHIGPRSFSGGAYHLQPLPDRRLLPIRSRQGIHLLYTLRKGQPL